MALAPEIELSDEEIEDLIENEDDVPETTTYAIDWQEGRIAGKVDSEEALRQYIQKTLMTEAGKFLIYNQSYGSSIKELSRSQNLSRAAIEAMIPKMVEGALTDNRILGVYDFSFEYPDEDSILISFYVDTIYGEDYEEVTI